MMTNADAFARSLPNVGPVEGFTLLAERCVHVLDEHRSALRYGTPTCVACDEIYPCLTRRALLGHTNGHPEPGPYGPGGAA